MSALPSDSTNLQKAVQPVNLVNPAQTAALQRLALSRAGLRGAMIAPPEPPDSASGAAPSRLLRQLWRQLRRATRESPIADLALGALQAWWSTRPWRPALNELRDSVDTTVVPLVRKHPWAAVGLAAGVGAALVYWRPWRWAAARGDRPAWHAGLLTQVLQQAANLPWGAILGAVMAGLAARRAAAPPASTASPASATAPPEAPPHPAPEHAPGAD